jgi:hypothetical protein
MLLCLLCFSLCVHYRKELILTVMVFIDSVLLLKYVVTDTDIFVFILTLGKGNIETLGGSNKLFS